MSWIANPVYGLPLLLYGIGIVLIFSGVVWVQLTRRARSHQTPPSVAEEAGNPTVAEEEFDEITSFGRESDRKPKGRTSQRGVGAIFSSDEDWNTMRRDRPRTAWVSKRLLLDIIGWSLFLVFYAGLVQEYNSNVFMQLWVRKSFPIAEYLLNNYALLVIATIAGVLMTSLLLQKWRLREVQED